MKKSSIRKLTIAGVLVAVAVVGMQSYPEEQTWHW